MGTGNSNQLILSQKLGKRNTLHVPGSTGDITFYVQDDTKSGGILYMYRLLFR